MKALINYQKLWDLAKAALRENFIPIQEHIGKNEAHINNLPYQLEKPEREQVCFEIRKSRAQNNDTANNKPIQTLNERIGSLKE